MKPAYFAKKEAKAKEAVAIIVTYANKEWEHKEKWIESTAKILRDTMTLKELDSFVFNLNSLQYVESLNKLSEKQGCSPTSVG